MRLEDALLSSGLTESAIRLHGKGFSVMMEYQSLNHTALLIQNYRVGKSYDERIAAVDDVTKELQSWSFFRNRDCLFGFEVDCAGEETALTAAGSVTRRAAAASAS